MASSIQAQNPLARNRLTFIERTTPVGTRPHKALYRCECGSKVEAFEGNVRRGHTRSCGCLQSETREARGGVAVRHGHFVDGHPSDTYKSWQAMIARCTNPKHPAFSRYGGRGIEVCITWLNSFDAFLADMGDRPSGRTLDRRDNDRGYEPDNCRWATRKEQNRNRSDNVFYIYQGQKMMIDEIMALSGCQLPMGTVRSRLWKGVDLDDALSLPRHEYQRRFLGPRRHADRSTENS